MSGLCAVEVGTAEGGRVPVVVRGEIDASCSDSVLQALRDAAASDVAADVVVDLSDVSFIDSSGLTAFVLARREILESGSRRLTIGAMSDRVRKLLEITELYGLLT